MLYPLSYAGRGPTLSSALRGYLKAKLTAVWLRRRIACNERRIRRGERRGACRG